MPHDRFTVADPAKLQVENLPKPEQAALRALFSGPRAVNESKATDGEHFVARLGMRRVLWRRDDRGRPVILGVVDQSYAAGV